MTVMGSCLSESVEHVDHTRSTLSSIGDLHHLARPICPLQCAQDQKWLDGGERGHAAPECHDAWTCEVEGQRGAARGSICPPESQTRLSGHKRAQPCPPQALDHLEISCSCQSLALRPSWTCSIKFRSTRGTGHRYTLPVDLVFSLCVFTGGPLL